MDKYKINRNRGPLTPEDVQKGQDFDQFMKTWSARPGPFSGSKTFFVSVAAAGVIISVGTWIVLSNTGTTANPTPATAFISPALKGIDINDTTYVVDAQQGGDFVYKTGSFIRIPQDAFLDSAGNKVSGNVEIRYREFHDPASIFLAGIPMTYDSAGRQFHFESAGMLEITAWQNGKPLRANPGEPVNVAMVSDTKEDKFNIYFLDTLKKNWSFIARDKAELVAMADVQDSAPAKTIAPPVAPVKAAKDKHSFAIEFDPQEFPELTVYKGVRFEVDEEKTPYNRADAKVKWEDVSIKRNSDKKTYTITFTRDQQSCTYSTYAVVDEKNYAAAMKTYNEKYAAYERSVNMKNAAAATRDKENEDNLAMADARRIFVNDSVMKRALALRRANVGNDPHENMVMREFMLRDFGIWNSDCPASLPQGPEIYAKIIDRKTGSEIPMARVFLVEKGKNAIWTYYSDALAHFKFNDKADNLLWGITPDGKLAVMGSDGFKNLNLDQKEVKLEMAVSEKPLLTPEQAIAALGI